jgi:hypothetical protein
VSVPLFNCDNAQPEEETDVTYKTRFEFEWNSRTYFHRLIGIDELKKEDERGKNTMALNRGGYAESD